MALEDPRAAVEWAHGLGAERGGNAHSAAVIIWSQDHAGEASEYAMTVPQGKERANLLYVTGANLFRADIGAGESWLSGLEGEADRLAGRQAIMVGAPEAQHERLLKLLGEE